MPLFYASLEIAVLATIEAIRLVIQIPLRTERRTYLIYAPVPLYPGYLFYQSTYAVDISVVMEPLPSYQQFLIVGFPWI
jgi:hypothetical protein